MKRSSLGLSESVFRDLGEVVLFEYLALHYIFGHHSFDETYLFIRTYRVSSNPIIFLISYTLYSSYKLYGCLILVPVASSLEVEASFQSFLQRPLQICLYILQLQVWLFLFTILFDLIPNLIMRLTLITEV